MTIDGIVKKTAKISHIRSQITDPMKPGLLYDQCRNEFTQGAQEMDQQWINSGAKQCSQRLNKQISLPICFFLEQTK